MLTFKRKSNVLSFVMSLVFPSVIHIDVATPFHCFLPFYSSISYALSVCPVFLLRSHLYYLSCNFVHQYSYLESRICSTGLRRTIQPIFRVDDTVLIYSSIRVNLKPNLPRMVIKHRSNILWQQNKQTAVNECCCCCWAKYRVLLFIVEKL